MGVGLIYNGYTGGGVKLTFAYLYEIRVSIEDVAR